MFKPVAIALVVLTLAVGGFLAYGYTRANRYTVNLTCADVSQGFADLTSGQQYKDGSIEKLRAASTLGAAMVYARVKDADLINEHGIRDALKNADRFNEFASLCQAYPTLKVTTIVPYGVDENPAHIAAAQAEISKLTTNVKVTHNPAVFELGFNSALNLNKHNPHNVSPTQAGVQ